jgi:hypothetical protein
VLIRSAVKLLDSGDNNDFRNIINLLCFCRSSRLLSFLPDNKRLLTTKFFLDSSR